MATQIGREALVSARLWLYQCVYVLLVLMPMLDPQSSDCSSNEAKTTGRCHGICCGSLLARRFFIRRDRLVTNGTRLLLAGILSLVTSCHLSCCRRHFRRWSSSLVALFLSCSRKIHEERGRVLRCPHCATIMRTCNGASHLPPRAASPLAP